MLYKMNYDRSRALTYARTWAFGRNPLFLNFAGIGGDCTNFISQCVYAGCCVMNYAPTFGWYYISADDRAPAWTGVQYFYNFMTANEGAGPYASEVDAAETLPGDVVQLARDDGAFAHSLLITGRSGSELLVAAHSDDAYDRPLSEYAFPIRRFLHIRGCRVPLYGGDSCFNALLSGKSL